MREALKRLYELASYGQASFWGSLIREIAYSQRRENIIVVISEGGFRGNTKYAFLTLWDFIKNRNLNVKIYYVGSNVEVEMLRNSALPAISLENEWQKAALILLNAKIAIYGDHDFVKVDSWFRQSLLAGAIKIQLWHGIPMKKVGAAYLPRSSDIFHFAGLLYDTHTSDFVISESRICADEYKQAFPRSKVLAFGAIRNDMLVKKYSSSFWRLGLTNRIYEALEKEKVKGRRIVLCCPTYREQHDNTDSFTKWFRALLSLRSTQDTCVVFKMHPLHVRKHPKDMVTALHICKSIKCFFVPPDDDIHPYYMLADCLVTDYSSVWLDFLLCDRPIIFYWPDISTYTKFRDLVVYPKINISNVGPICYNTYDLVTCVSKEIESFSYADNVRRCARLFHRNAIDAGAGKRLCRLVQWLLDRGFLYFRPRYNRFCEQYT